MNLRVLVQELQAALEANQAVDPSLLAPEVIFLFQKNLKAKKTKFDLTFCQAGMTEKQKKMHQSKEETKLERVIQWNTCYACDLAIREGVKVL